LLLVDMPLVIMSLSSTVLLHNAMLARYMPSSCVSHSPVLYQNG